MYSAEIFSHPFWAENSGFMTGRDPLGIQNSSITVYGRLLPGLTNLTLRLRYYGLYCWLLAEYDKIPTNGAKKNLEHQYNFIRRAELAIAFIMLKFDASQTSIIGSDYSNRNILEVDLFGYYNIGKGADKFKETEKGSVYWDFPSGALGQYYAGSLIGLDLVEFKEKFFHIREKGSTLATAFEKSIKPETQALFLRILEKGVLTLSDIDQLNDFAINKITYNSEEWLLYCELLFQDDGSRFKTSDGKFSSKRKDTIKLFLEYINGETHDLPFQATQFQLVENEKYACEASFGWYYYYINEAIHYCIETMFWGMLVELDGKNIPIHDFINLIVRSTANEMKKANFNVEDSTVFDILSKIESPNLIDELKLLEQLTRSPSNSKEALSFAILLLLKIYVKVEGRLGKISDFENLNYLQFQKGIVSEYMQNFVSDFYNHYFHKFLESIVKMIINDHIATAYRKMGNGESNLLKFVIEDGMIGHVQTMSPKFTNPRIRTLNNFLIDLGYIQGDGKLTVEGKEIVTQIA